ncbi:MAG: glycoside hydrolase family 5 protein, partial [Bacteroidales bacterium]|nr:glycoside hydrolase family 5 protein [Bacteroidales bacterium]
MKRIYLVIGLIISITCSNAQVTPQEAIIQMRKGINLGNTLEASPGETSWGNPLTKEYQFDMYQEEGFNTVRVPVRWDARTGKSSPYAIEDSFLDRVEEIVDWGLERDLWIVINAHHDDWIKNDYSATNKARFDSIWSQVAVRFAGKSEKLVFEILNEPHGMSKADNDDMHARVLSIIRKTNPTRLVIFQGNNWGSSGDLINAAIPDPDDEYLIGSFHSYDPWPFGLEGTGSFGSTAQINTLRDKFQSVKNWSDNNNIPVFLGEFACHKDADFMSRMKHYQTYVELSHEFGFCYCSWDDGGNFKIMNRAEGTWKEMKDILIYGNPDSPGYPGASIQDDSIIRISWDNRVTDNDHIIVQRGSSATSLHSIDTISSEKTEYLDINPGEDRTFYYRLIADYADSISYYSYPLKIYIPTYVPPGYNIHVQVTDKSNGNAVQVADIIVNGLTKTSNYLGESYFIEYDGTYDLSIEKEYYQKIEDQVLINSDTLLRYEMVPTHSDVKIWVRDTSDNPLN